MTLDELKKAMDDQNARIERIRARYDSLDVRIQQLRERLNRVLAELDVPALTSMEVNCD